LIKFVSATHLLLSAAGWIARVFVMAVMVVLFLLLLRFFSLFLRLLLRFSLVLLLLVKLFVLFRRLLIIFPTRGCRIRSYCCCSFSPRLGYSRRYISVLFLFLLLLLLLFLLIRLYSSHLPTMMITIS